MEKVPSPAAGYTVGMTGNLTSDKGFEHVTNVPQAVALTWLGEIAPDAGIGVGAARETVAQLLAAGLDLRSKEWLRRVTDGVFVVVTVEHGVVLVLALRKGSWSLWSKAS